MSRTDVLEAPEAGMVMLAVAEAPDRLGAVTAADIGAAIADEIGRLDEEGHRLQILASRMARDARPEFEAWFEAGLLLRRASERLAEIAQKLA